MNAPLEPADHVVVVGGSAGGVSTVEALRSGGHKGPITLVGTESYPPYDRPPLSKKLLDADFAMSSVFLREEDHLPRLDITELRGRRAVALDIANQSLELDDGSALNYDRLVVATGVSPKWLPGAAKVPGVVTLRTLDDAAAVRTALAFAQRVVVIGAGFVGMEIAATCAAGGFDVVVACSGTAPLQSAIGREVGEQLLGIHASRGVRFRTGRSARVASVVVESGAVAGVCFETGDFEPADLVVIAVGSSPATDWLASSGLDLEDGIVCAADCSAAPGVYAVGDVARWHNPAFERSMRIEHRTNAIDQAIHVARQLIAGTTDEYAPIPFFWSDQFELKLQGFGYLREHDECLVAEGSLAAGRMIALYRKGTRLTGVLGVGAAKALRKWRNLIDGKASWEEVLAQL